MELKYDVEIPETKAGSSRCGKNVAVVKEFLASGKRTAEMAGVAADNKSAYKVYISFAGMLHRKNFPVKAAIRGNRVFLMRTDM